MVEPAVVEAKLREGIADIEHLELKDLTGTKDHYDATIVSSAFEGKTRVEQHQLVYGALGDLMTGPVHALALKTFTPSRWAEKKG